MNVESLYVAARARKFTFAPFVLTVLTINDLTSMWWNIRISLYFVTWKIWRISRHFVFWWLQMYNASLLHTNHFNWMSSYAGMVVVPLRFLTVTSFAVSCCSVLMIRPFAVNGWNILICECWPTSNSVGSMTSGSGVVESVDVATGISLISQSSPEIYSTSGFGSPCGFPVVGRRRTVVAVWLVNRAWSKMCV